VSGCLHGTLNVLSHTIVSVTDSSYHSEGDPKYISELDHSPSASKHDTFSNKTNAGIFRIINTEAQ